MAEKGWITERVFTTGREPKMIKERRVLCNRTEKFLIVGWIDGAGRFVQQRRYLRSSGQSKIPRTEIRTYRYEIDLESWQPS